MAPRPRPGASKTNEAQTKTMGEPDKGSRAKAEAAHERANDEITRANAQPSDSPAEWPRGANGTPMMKAEMAAAELIPTGQYANVSVGPARIHFLIDPDRELGPDESYFSDQQRDTIARALNEVAEIAEGDVVAVQRNLVLESLQEQVSNN